MLQRICEGRGLTLAPASAVLFTAITIGCGEPGPTDVEQVMVEISNLPDAARDATSFQQLFVDGAAPDAERERYSQYVFNTDEPTVEGETATVNVQVIDVSGLPVAEREWAFVRIDGQWKIQHAPLP